MANNRPQRPPSQDLGTVLTNTVLTIYVMMGNPDTPHILATKAFSLELPGRIPNSAMDTVTAETADHLQRAYAADIADEQARRKFHEVLLMMEASANGQQLTPEFIACTPQGRVV